TLHAPTCVIHGEQQWFVTLGMYGLAQGRQLFAMIEIAREQDDAPRPRMTQALALVMRQRRAFHIYHDGARRQTRACVVNCHKVGSVESLRVRARVSTTTKAATVSVSSVTEMWALPKRWPYQLANGSDSCTRGLPLASFRVCMRDHAMGLCMPRPMALEKASLAAKRVARKRRPRCGSRW